MAFRCEDTAITCSEEQYIYPTITNNILDISALKHDSVFNHNLDPFNPMNLVIVSRNDNPNLTIYLKAKNLHSDTSVPDTRDDCKKAFDQIYESIQNNSMIDESFYVKKHYNDCPLIVNTTSAKIVLMGYQIDFLIDSMNHRDTEASANNTQKPIVDIRTALLCNSVHSVIDASIRIREIKSNPVILNRSSTHIETNHQELMYAKQYYVPNNYDVSTDQFHRLNQVRDGFVCTFNPKYNNDISLAAFIGITETKSQINYCKLKKNRKYSIINFNGLIVDVCTGKIENSKFVINSSIIRMSGRYMNGLVGGFVDTLKNVTLDVKGNVELGNSMHGLFSGMFSGISKWIDNVKLTIEGDAKITGKVSGLISGSASGMYNNIECSIKDKIDLFDEKRFGTIIGFLSPNTSKSTSQMHDDLDDEFKFRYLLTIGKKTITTVRSRTSNTDYGIIGTIDQCDIQNNREMTDLEIDKITEIQSDMNCVNVSSYCDKQDSEGICDVKINLNIKDSNTVSKFRSGFIMNRGNISNDNNCTNATDTSCRSRINDVLDNMSRTTKRNDFDLKQGNPITVKLVNEESKGYNFAQNMFDHIKTIRKTTGFDERNDRDTRDMKDDEYHNMNKIDTSYS